MKLQIFSLILFAGLLNNGAWRCWIVFTVTDKSADRRRPHPRSMATMSSYDLIFLSVLPSHLNR